MKTLEEILNKYDIKIPRMQRDYAQGRSDAHATKVREKLLDDIKRALTDQTSPLDLKFVYGKVEKGVFVPIDGQQRLTTLLLLHIFAYRDDDSKTPILNKFHYDTRISARDFLKMLVKKRKEVFGGAQEPSEWIKDASWFDSAWSFDPTVQSVLTMLDAIKARFSDIPDLASRLNGNRVIFQYCDISTIGMEDSLYIRLNARGKALTDFENFKALMIKRLEELRQEPTTDKALDNFESKLDGEWTDFFWKLSKDKKFEGFKFDGLFLNFFEVMIGNHLVKGLKKGFKHIYDQIFDDSGEWKFSDALKELDEEWYLTIIYCLDYLCGNGNNEMLDFGDEVLKQTKGKTGKHYPERVLLHSLSKYLYEEKGSALAKPDCFEEWMRILSNLVRNSQIDSKERYSSAISSVNGLLYHRDTMVSDLASSKVEIPFFDGSQKKEEREKAIIIAPNRNSDFARYIEKKSEKHPYFSGQIRSALYLARDDTGKYDFAIFRSYWEKIALLFAEEKRNERLRLLRQALLALGDYTTPVANAYLTFSTDNPNSDSSFKSLFSDAIEIYRKEGKKNYIKELLDKLSASDDLETQLHKIINTEIKNIQPKDWRYCFLRFPKLFDNYMSKETMRIKFVRNCYPNDHDPSDEVHEECIMVKKQISTGYNYEVYTSALEQYLNLIEKCPIKVSHEEDDMGTTGKRSLICKSGDKKSIVFYRKNLGFVILDEKSGLRDIVPASEQMFDEVFGKLQ